MLIFPLVNDTSRKIIHIDMDAFFASVEERDNPQRESLSSSDMIPVCLADEAWYRPAIMRLENMASIRP